MRVVAKRINERADQVLLCRSFRESGKLHALDPLGQFMYLDFHTHGNKGLLPGQPSRPTGVL